MCVTLKLNGWCIFVCVHLDSNYSVTYNIQNIVDEEQKNLDFVWHVQSSLHLSFCNFLFFSYKELPMIVHWNKANRNQRQKCTMKVSVGLTFEGFGWCFSAAGGLWNKHTLSKHLDIKACIVKRHLGIFLQLLRKVSSRCGGHCVGPVAAILRDLQLFHETHGPGGGGVISNALLQQKHF